MHRLAREPNAEVDLACDCTCLDTFALRTQVLDVFHSVIDVFFFSIFNFCERRKKIIFDTREIRYNFFFYNNEAESSLYIYVEFYFSRV